MNPTTHPNATAGGAAAAAVLLIVSLLNRLADAGVTAEEAGLATTIAVYLVLRFGRRSAQA